MPVYVFRWSDDEEPTQVDLPNDDAAWSEAVATLGLVLRDIDGSLPSPSDLGLSVEDEAGRLVATMNVHAERGGRTVEVATSAEVAARSDPATPL